MLKDRVAITWEFKHGCVLLQTAATDKPFLWALEQTGDGNAVRAHRFKGKLGPRRLVFARPGGEKNRAVFSCLPRDFAIIGIRSGQQATWHGLAVLAGYCRSGAIAQDLGNIVREPIVKIDMRW